MSYNSAQEVFSAVVQAYYNERSIDAILACVTEDIFWLGTEKNEAALGKPQLRALLERKLAEYNDKFEIEFNHIDEEAIAAGICIINARGRQIAIADEIYTSDLRGTLVCVQTKQGWLIKNIHLSMDNAERENFRLVRELQETRRKQQTLMAGIPGGVAIYRIKKDGTVPTEYVSEGLAKMCGYASAEEFLNYLRKDSRINLVPEDVETVLEAVQRSLEAHTPLNVVYRIYKKDGTIILSRLDANIIKDVELLDDEVAVLYAVHTEVSTETQKKMKAQNQQLQTALRNAELANKAKTDFLSRVSHDMRTPLNGILGLTKLLKDNVIDTKALQDLSQLELSGRYLLNLINDTLDVSKIESGKLELHPVVCDGRSVLNNVIAMIQSSLSAKKIKFKLHADNVPFTLLYIDVGRVEQILMNILGNAVKFTPEGGTIEFIMTNLSIKDGVIIDEIVIRDNGIGMSEEFLPHIFEPFMQENNGRTSSYQGTGLGMTITKQIIGLMDGEISVKSCLGKGTEFKIILPFPIADDSQIDEWKTELIGDMQNYTLNGKRILLCEDHPLNATIATRLLNNKGIEVERAENGNIGVEMYKKSEPYYYDAVLMDIRMPVLDGIAATKAIRALPRTDAGIVPIIAMTANAFDDDVQQTKRAGMDAHLSKPIETEKLYSILETLLNLKRVLKRHKILVVDDVEVNREIIKETLKGEYDILEANNGWEALEILEINKGIDAIITDIQMPEMNGVELIKRIRAEKKYRHIAIIANTQFGDPEQEEELLALGANDFVYKPTTPKIVKIRVHNALRKV